MLPSEQALQDFPSFLISLQVTLLLGLEHDLVPSEHTLQT